MIYNFPGKNSAEMKSLSEAMQEATALLRCSLAGKIAMSVKVEEQEMHKMVSLLMTFAEHNVEIDEELKHGTLKVKIGMRDATRSGLRTVGL